MRGAASPQRPQAPVVRACARKPVSPLDGNNSPYPASRQTMLQFPPAAQNLGRYILSGAA